MKFSRFVHVVVVVMAVVNHESWKDCHLIKQEVYTQRCYRLALWPALNHAGSPSLSSRILAWYHNAMAVTPDACCAISSVYCVFLTHIYIFVVAAVNTYTL